MEVAKISSKRQITVPVSVRSKLNLKAGDKVVILDAEVPQIIYNIIGRICNS